MPDYGNGDHNNLHLTGQKPQRNEIHHSDRYTSIDTNKYQHTVDTSSVKPEERPIIHEINKSIIQGRMQNVADSLNTDF